MNGTAARLLAGFAIAALLFLSGSARPARFDWSRRIGLAAVGFPGGDFRMVIPNADLSPGDSVTLVGVPVEGGPKWRPEWRPLLLQVHVARRLHSPAGLGWPWPVPLGAGDTVYEIDGMPQITPPVPTCFAVVAPRRIFKMLSQGVQADLDRDGVPETFQMTASWSGVCFAVRSGGPRFPVDRWRRCVPPPEGRPSGSWPADSLLIFGRGR